MPDLMKFWMQAWGMQVPYELLRLQEENKKLKDQVATLQAANRIWELNEQAMRSWTEPMPWEDYVNPVQFGWNVFGKSEDKK